MNKEKSIWKNAFSGLSGGFICTIICAPLDIAKVRQQVQGSLKIHSYNGILQTLNKIFEIEGFKGLFKGMGTALMNVPLFWGIYWASYEEMKYILKDSTLSPTFQTIISATIAGGFADTITNPFWVVRTRIQTLIFHPESSFQTISTFSMFQHIYKNEGVFAFYKGLSASYLGLTHVAIQFPLYENLKEYYKKHRKDEELTLLDYIVSSSVSKFIASTLTYPHEVLRVRLQDHRNLTNNNTLQYSKSSLSLFKLVKNIIHEEGVKALWSGFRLNMIRILPSTTTHFVTYEYVSRHMKNYESS